MMPWPLELLAELRRSLAWRGKRLRRRLMRLRGRLRRALGRPPLKQIILCGYSRGGTSLLYNMVSSSLVGFVCDQAETDALDSIQKWEHHVSKNPVDVFAIPDVVKANLYGKDIHVIVCIRDLRDIITSKHPNIPDRYAINFLDRWSPQGTYGQYTATKSPLGVQAVHAAIERLRSQPGIHLHIVKYEDVVADADGVQRRLAEAMGVRFRRPFSEFHEHPEDHAYRYTGRFEAKDPSLVRENSAVDTSRRGKWRRPEHAARIREQFGAHPELFRILRQYGYETDDAWFEAYIAAPHAAPTVDTVHS